MSNRCIILDRDGILNRLLKDPVYQIRGPRIMKEVKTFHWVPSCVNKLYNFGFSLAVATNQPGFAKGETTKENIEEVHNFILNNAQSEGGKIASSHICWHRAEDLCPCRKPKTGLLEQAFEVDFYDKRSSWMVGDRATDIIAGNAFGINTALLGPSVKDDINILKQNNLSPTYHGKDLRDFVKFIGDKYGNSQ